MVDKKHVKISKEKHDIIKKQSHDTGISMQEIVDEILSKALMGLPVAVLEVNEPEVEF